MGDFFALSYHLKPHLSKAWDAASATNSDLPEEPTAARHGRWFATENVNRCGKTMVFRGKWTMIHNFCFFFKRIYVVSLQGGKQFNFFRVSQDAFWTEAWTPRTDVVPTTLRRSRPGCAAATSLVHARGRRNRIDRTVPWIVGAAELLGVGSGWSTWKNTGKNTTMWGLDFTMGQVRDPNSRWGF